MKKEYIVEFKDNTRFITDKREDADKIYRKVKNDVRKYYIKEDDNIVVLYES